MFVTDAVVGCMVLVVSGVAVVVGEVVVAVVAMVVVGEVVVVVAIVIVDVVVVVVAEVVVVVADADVGDEVGVEVLFGALVEVTSSPGSVVMGAIVGDVGDAIVTVTVLVVSDVVLKLLTPWPSTDVVGLEVVDVEKTTSCLSDS